MSSDEPAFMRQRVWARLRGRLFHTWFLLRRPMTFGVRGVIYDASSNAVFLVRHTYVPGWHFPGGGVEAGETALESLGRELMEEANIELLSMPVLKSLHFNRQSSRRDHVAVYLITDYRQTGPKTPDAEVAEAGFFSIDALPQETTPATRRRVAELFAGEPPAAYW
ncbi:MAG: NUDIX domain-containing protein [Aquamicrobium sp.]|nr:NUDIX domain-containing protein [Aquamicrobium sp.]